VDGIYQSENNECVSLTTIKFTNSNLQVPGDQRWLQNDARAGSSSQLSTNRGLSQLSSRHFLSTRTTEVSICRRGTFQYCFSRRFFSSRPTISKPRSM
jgi:hypothetical protein